MEKQSGGPFDIVVAGSGPTGLLSALALCTSGFRVALIGPRAKLDDGRTTALMSPALAFLDNFGLLADIASQAAPLKVMRIVDATRRLIRSPVVTFHAAEIGEAQFGMNVPNRVLNGALEAKVRSMATVAWFEGLADEWSTRDDQIVATWQGGQIHARLAVAADGRESNARESAGIVVRAKIHGQSALALSFLHSRGHAFASTEFHTENGPFTQVPLLGDRSSLVWVADNATAARLAAMPLPELSREVEDRMQSMLGEVEVEVPPQIYPLSESLPDSFGKNRVALVGEAAHTFPPIGAQGLNLGIRDVQQLVEICEANRDDPGRAHALAAYDRQRRPDILARSGAVGLLNGSLLSNMLPAQIARSAGLGLLGAFAPLRSFFMREGLRPGSGFGSFFSTVREQVRR